MSKNTPSSTPKTEQREAVDDGGYAFPTSIAACPNANGDIAEFVKKAFRPMLIGGCITPVVNVPYMWGSDAAHLLCKEYVPGSPAGFAAYYWDRDGFREFGLRSLPDGMDVSEVAKLYGGGGHKHAAGFRVPFGHELAR